MENFTTTNNFSEVDEQFLSWSTSNNKYVYFKQNFLPNIPEQKLSSKVLVNPHFNKKVFVNPNYIINNLVPTTSGNIHVNPNITLSLPVVKPTSKIHVNPKILKNTLNVLGEKLPVKTNLSDLKHTAITYSSKTKLIRKPVKDHTVQETKRIRRTSLHSKYKLIKSSVLNINSEMKTKNKLLFNSKYKLRRESTNKSIKTHSPVKLLTRFKLDNRRKAYSNISHKNTKYVFVNRFLSISDIAKRVPLKTNRGLNLLNISGVIYKNSPHRLQRVVKKEKKKHILPKQKLSKCTRYKIVRVSQSRVSSPNKKIDNRNLRLSIRKPKISGGNLKKCNIPCPIYRKFGKCKRNELRKCHRKHDPDQIALCTKFLQGACIDPKCLLSHNVSAEKMPTCKFYLEGSCSRDSCPYLHVRISPKADICKEFLEGFCKKASECDKRHQFLCPDFEKKGHCLKPRCPYPHGRMVRKYSNFNKQKFAKKSSKICTNSKSDKNLVNKKIEDKIEPEEANPTVRYYSDQKVELVNSLEKPSSAIDFNRQTNFRLRPKLGELPSFISLEDS